MYRSHPGTNELALIIPSTYVQAAMNEQRIPLPVFCEMRECVQRLADLAEALQPDLVLFFATGGIPYAFPMMSVLMRRQVWGLVDGRFHMFPGLSWDGMIGGVRSDEYCISELRRLIGTLRTTSPQGSHLRILALDTVHSGTGINKLIKTLNAAISPSHGPVATNVVGIVSHGKASRQNPGDAMLEVVGPLGSVWLQKPSVYAGPQTTTAFEWLELPMHSDGHDLRLSCWVYSSIPTEDNADIMGVSSAHDELSVKATGKPGRIILTADEGVEVPVLGGRTIGDSLLNLLAVPEGSVALMAVEHQFANRLPNGLQAGADEIHRTSAELFELDQGNPIEVVSWLLSSNRLLTATQVYWLASRGHLGHAWESKLNASVRKSGKPDDCLNALREARPDLAVSEPAPSPEVDPVAWWVKQVCE